MLPRDATYIQEDIIINHRGDIYFTYRRTSTERLNDFLGPYLAGSASIMISFFLWENYAIGAYVAASFVLSSLLTWWAGRTVTVVLPKSLFRLSDEIKSRSLSEEGES